MMDEYVREYLLNYGFNEEQIKIIESNPYISQVTKTHAYKIIKYLEEYKIDKNIIIDMISTNKWLISENYYRINAIENIFRQLNFDNIEYKTILENNYKTLTINPNELIKTINYINSKNNKSNIKEILSKNSNIVSEKYETAIGYVNNILKNN